MGTMTKEPKKVHDKLNAHWVSAIEKFEDDPDYKGNHVFHYIAKNYPTQAAKTELLRKIQALIPTPPGVRKEVPVGPDNDVVLHLTQMRLDPGLATKGMSRHQWVAMFPPRVLVVHGGAPWVAPRMEDV